MSVKLKKGNNCTSNGIFSAVQYLRFISYNHCCLLDISSSSHIMLHLSRAITIPTSRTNFNLEGLIHVFVRQLCISHLICTSVSDQINFLIQFTDRAFHFNRISVLSYMHTFVLTDITIFALILLILIN